MENSNAHSFHSRKIAFELKPGDIVLVGGLSRSGKTTFSNNLSMELNSIGLSHSLIALDRWIKNLGERTFGVMGRYELSHISRLIDEFQKDGKDPIKIELPEYDKLKQISLYKGESISIPKHHILIIEGTLALTLAGNGIMNVKKYFTQIKESERKRRVINEYLQRGKNINQAECIYHGRQVDETPIIEASLKNGIKINL